MFVEIIDRVIESPTGEQVHDISMGLLLNIDGQEQAVAIRDLTDIYLDDEEIDLATKLYVTYRDQEFAFDVPQKATADWQYLQDLIDME